MFAELASKHSSKGAKAAAKPKAVAKHIIPGAVPVSQSEFKVGPLRLFLSFDTTAEALIMLAAFVAHQLKLLGWVCASRPT